MSGASSSISGTSTGVISDATTFDVLAGAASDVGRCTITVTGNSTMNGALNFSNATGTKTFNGNVTVGGSGSITFSAAVTLAMNGSMTTNPGSVVGGGGATGTANLAGNLTLVTGGASSLGGLNFNISGNLAVPGTAVWDASSGTNAITIPGNWNVTSAAADPFVEGTASTVTFNGSSGT